MLIPAFQRVSLLTHSNLLVPQALATAERVDEALETSVTCMDCLEVISNAVHCPKCHHHGCRPCMDADATGLCKDCMGDSFAAGRALSDVEASMKAQCVLQAVPAIDNIASKFEHRTQVTRSLRSIIGVCACERASMRRTLMLDLNAY